MKDPQNNPNKLTRKGKKEGKDKTSNKKFGCFGQKRKIKIGMKSDRGSPQKSQIKNKG